MGEIEDDDKGNLVVEHVAVEVRQRVVGGEPFVNGQRGVAAHMDRHA